MWACRTSQPKYAAEAAAANDGQEAAEARAGAEAEADAAGQQGEISVSAKTPNYFRR
jgi:hypothetical protein